MNILHGLTGSVATTLFSKISDKYISEKDKGIDVQYVLTNTSRIFIRRPLPYTERILCDHSEWDLYEMNKRVLHIELVQWADVFVIAPLSANTLAKLANGICDNLLTCVARAWDFKKPFIVAPAMNNLMYSHPITEQHLTTIKSWGVTIVPPQTKKLFCGTYGLGAMAEIDDIMEKINLY